MTAAGRSGLLSVPLSKADTKLAWSFSAMAAPPLSRSSFCMSVSTRPGLIATAEMFGSSTATWRAREFKAAFEDPYAPQLVYAFVAAPEDTNTMLPFVARRCGMVSLTFVMSIVLSHLLVESGLTSASALNRLTSKSLFHSSTEASTRRVMGDRAPWLMTTPSSRPNFEMAS
jgi:hypothetical protein